MSLDIETESKKWRERVRQVQEHRCGDDADEAEVVGNCGCNDKRNGPPDWDNGCVNYLAACGGKGWCAEDVYQDVVVEDFDADVAIETCGNESSDQRNHVARSLPAVDANAHVAGIKAVLALEVIYKASVHEVHGVDEELCSPHSFDEVTGSFHLGQEFHEELSACVCQNS